MFYQTTISCRILAKTYNNGQLRNASNHSNLLKLTKGYYDYHQRVDISSNLFQIYEAKPEASVTKGSLDLHEVCAIGISRFCSLDDTET